MRMQAPIRIGRVPLFIRNMDWLVKTVQFTLTYRDWRVSIHNWMYVICRYAVQFVFTYCTMLGLLFCLNLLDLYTICLNAMLSQKPSTMLTNICYAKVALCSTT